MPPDPPRAFLASQSASNLFCSKRLKKMWKLCPPFKISRYATGLPRLYVNVKLNFLLVSDHSVKYIGRESYLRSFLVSYWFVDKAISCTIMCLVKTTPENNQNKNLDELKHIYNKMLRG